MHHPLVVNVNKSEYDVYIGRKKNCAVHYGNPFSHNWYPGVSVVVGSVEEAVQCFEDWLDGKAWQNIEPMRREWILRHIPDLENMRLGCFGCEPVCHGDVLARRANRGK